MSLRPSRRRGGVTAEPFSSDDPLICAHQAVQLKLLLAEFVGRYEESWMVLDRLEIVYHCAGRREDADRVYADKIALTRRPGSAPREYGEGLFARIAEYVQIVLIESRFRRGQGAVDQTLAELHRRAPWEQIADAVRDSA